MGHLPTRGWRQWAALVVAGTLLMSAATAQAPGDLRIALVIGNSRYGAGAALQNPANDARAMSEALKRLGFTVVDLRDASKAATEAAIAQIQAGLQGKHGVGMLYYAGHGVQHDWRNFMVPVDARLKTAADIPLATVDVAHVLEAFKAAGNRLNILVLDACRDNPFDNQLATLGLAPVDAPVGTFMAFATAAGHVADDGDSQSANGLYTQYLLQELKQPAARIEDVFKRVKVHVREKSQGRQIPWESSNLDEEFSFEKGFAAVEPNTQAARMARYNAERQEWDRIKNSRAPAEFFDFLQRYPNGFFTEIAQFRVDRLEKPVVVAQAGRDGIAPLVSGTNRFALGDAYTLVTTDLLTRVVQRAPQRVTFANDERVEVNGGASVFDQMGGVLRDDSGDKDPPVLLVPADIALGKKWRSVFQTRYGGFQVGTVVDFKTVALEDLDVEGVAYKAFKVDMEGFAESFAGNAFLKATLWIDPRTMRMVRWDRTLRGGGRILESSSILVTDYRPAPR